MICPMCGAWWYQRQEWEPDLAPRFYRRRCYECGWDTGWKEVLQSLSSDGPLWHDEPRARRGSRPKGSGQGAGHPGTTSQSWIRQLVDDLSSFHPASRRAQ